MGGRGRVLIGTSGYVYDDWRARFYPVSVPAFEGLGSYADRFPTVESNNSFDRLPAAETFRAWRRAVHDDAVFAGKASRFLTRLKRLKHARAAAATRGKRARDAAAIRGRRAKGLDVCVCFNNDWKAFAVENAASLADLVDGAGRVPRRRAA